MPDTERQILHDLIYMWKSIIVTLIGLVITWARGWGKTDNIGQIL
jgi:hypothetical protein